MPSEIEKILAETIHRPFEYPAHKWSYYQEWNNALFLHWKVSLEDLSEIVPEDLRIDTFDGNAYISLVAFTMQKIRPRNLPAIKTISDFDEINVRTYIDNKGKKGVYFLHIEAGKHLSALISKRISGLPYEKSDIHRSKNYYQSANRKKNFFLDTSFSTTDLLNTKTDLDRWLTERYCLYLDKNNTIYCYDIHHKEWDVKNVQLNKLKLDYKIGNIHMNQAPDLLHYSDGVKVLAWNKTKVVL